ncbi:MAG TPA: metallophosphoesterase family protein [Candidatus Nitrosotalea sp.]|nr:metallophosphoesterase family protein [Candidatus Nitrosotalea sp.]
MKIGVISDTHGYFDRKLTRLFSGVDHILHSGDIGFASIILELEQIAPVTAVLGNNDAGLEFNETEVIQLGDRKFLVHHIVDVRNPSETIKRRIIRENPDVVVFGHTHKAFCETIDRTLYFNPGYAGKARFNLVRSVAVLLCDGAHIQAELFDL